jgi:hypothetical protein
LVHADVKQISKTTFAARSALTAQAVTLLSTMHLKVESFSALMFPRWLIPLW